MCPCGCTDGNLCRTVVIFVVQVVSLVLTPLVLVFVNEAINPVVVVISIAFLLLLIVSLLCCMLCRCLYIRSLNSDCTTRSGCCECGESCSKEEQRGGTVRAAAGTQLASRVLARSRDAKDGAGRSSSVEQIQLMSASKTCATIVSHEPAANNANLGESPAEEAASTPAEAGPWEPTVPHHLRVDAGGSSSACGWPNRAASGQVV